MLDVTYGSGAFMKTIKEAEELSKIMNKIGNLVGRETICILTPMEQPLGESIGNNLEVIEAINFLKGNMIEDVKEVVLELGSNMIKLAGKGNNLEENKIKMLEQIANGKALDKFKELVQNQGGDTKYIDDINRFEKAKYIFELKAKKSGIVKSLKADEIGKLSVFLGAGRIKKEDLIDKTVGIVLKKKIGSEVKIGETLAYIHSNATEKGNTALNELEKIYEII